MHAAAETHDTPVSWLLVPGSGVGTADQLVPSQDSIRVVEAPLMVTDKPAADIWGILGHGVRI